MFFFIGRKAERKVDFLFDFNRHRVAMVLVKKFVQKGFGFFGINIFRRELSLLMFSHH